MNQPLLEKNALSVTDVVRTGRRVGKALRMVGGVPGRAARGVYRWGGAQAQALRHPVQTMQEGWRAMSPGYLARRYKKLAFSAKPEHVRELAQLKKANPGMLKRMEEAYHEAARASTKKRWGGLLSPKRREHLLEKSIPLELARRKGGAKAVAEELSRRGWTGTGRVTKYMPIGFKSGVGQIGLATASGISKKPTPEERAEGMTRGRKAGAGLGSVAGFLASTALPVGGIPGMMATEALFRRGGAAVGSALSGRPKPQPIRLTPQQVNIMRRAAR